MPSTNLFVWPQILRTVIGYSFWHRLASWLELIALNLVVLGSSPTVCTFFVCLFMRALCVISMTSHTTAVVLRSLGCACKLAQHHRLFLVYSLRNNQFCVIENIAAASAATLEAEVQQDSTVRLTRAARARLAEVAQV